MLRTISQPNRNHKKQKQSSKTNWNDELEKDFNNIKDKLKTELELVFYDPKAQLILTTDASNVAIGAVLEQRLNETNTPLAFFSRKLKPQEKKYSAFDRELLAVKHFQYIHEDEEFLTQSDHKPIVHALEMKSSSPRQLRQLCYISEFKTKEKQEKIIDKEE